MRYVMRKLAFGFLVTFKRPKPLYTAIESIYLELVPSMLITKALIALKFLLFACW